MDAKKIRDYTLSGSDEKNAASVYWDTKTDGDLCGWYWPTLSPANMLLKPVVINTVKKLSTDMTAVEAEKWVGKIFRYRGDLEYSVTY